MLTPFDVEDPKKLMKLALRKLKDERVKIDKIVLRSAKNNDGDALFKVGIECFKKGKYANAMNWWKLSTATGNTHAQIQVGRLYEFGRGVPQSREIARDWYESAGRRGNVSAYVYIGELIQHTDRRKAFAFYQRAVKYGDPNGINKIGECELYGLLHPPDEDMALFYFTQAAIAGSSKGQYNLAKMHELGRGVDMDKLAALQLYKRSLDGGCLEAKMDIKRLNALGYKLDSDEKKGFRNWLRKIFCLGSTS